MAWAPSPYALRSTTVNHGTVILARRDKHARAVPHQGRFLGLRTDDESWRVAQRQDGQVEGVARLDKARRLVGAIRVDGSAQVQWIIRKNPERPTFYADDRGDHPLAEARPSLQNRPGIGQGCDNTPRIVDRQPILRHETTQQSLVSTRPRLHRALE
jgi:hypothetical protein